MTNLSATRATDQPKLTYVTPNDPFWRRSFINCIEAVTGQKKLNSLYNQYRLVGETTGNIWADAISHLHLHIKGLTETESSIPANGPLVIVSNHPYGVLDGLSLCYAVSLIRQDFKFLAHSTFQKIPELEPFVLPVDFDGASSALRSNIETKKAAQKHVREGGAVVIFPAGRVSTAKTPFGNATDAEWKLFCGSLIQRSGARVVPVYFAGQNSWLFHLASRLGEAMREALLVHEIVRRMNTEVHAVVGDIIEFAQLEEFDNKRDMLNFLRDRVYALGEWIPSNEQSQIEMAK